MMTVEELNRIKAAKEELVMVPRKQATANRF